MSEQVMDWDKIKAPIVLTNEEWLQEKKKEEKDYLFYSQLEKLEEIIDTFESDTTTKEINKNIGIVGDRGTGKTSLVHTFDNLLRAKGYYVFNVVDPSVFEQNLTILEILVSNIYSLIKDPSHWCQNFESMDEDSHILRTDILTLLKKLTQTLANERQKTSYFKEKNPPIDVLDEIQNRLFLDNLITQVLQKSSRYLSLQGNKPKDFVLIIDDIDLLDNNTSNKLIHDIQKYLDTKLIIVLAYRESQLQLSLLDERVVEYEDLLRHQIETLREPNLVTLEELTLQNANLMNKLIPKSRRIYLFSPKELIDLNMDIVLKSISEGKLEERTYSKSAKKWIYDTVFSRTNLSIKPVDDREETSFFLPSNIRDLLQLAELLEDQMDAVLSVNQTTMGMYYNNLKKFIQYFQELSYEILPPTHSGFLKDWTLKDSYQKNYFSYHYLYELFGGNLDSEFFKNNNLIRYQSYNIALGDVYSIIEEYKDVQCKEEMDFFFVYALKVFYSCELSSLFYRSVELVKKQV